MIGILYESKEWSSYALENSINKMGISAKLIDMQDPIDPESLKAYELIVSRVFASAVFRDHEYALAQMPGVIEFLKENGIPMINPYEAHFYEISKKLSTNTLAANGFMVPKVYGVFRPTQLDPTSLTSNYPCIIKPDCGGRTTFTYIVNNPDEVNTAMSNAPDILFIAQEYIRPELGFITRIEVIGRECRLIVKRSISENGLSAYHLGSSYEIYKDCPEEIKNETIRAMDLLKIDVGSLDIIENKDGFFIIDVNSVSNVSEDNTEMFSFDLMKETAAYIVNRVRAL